MKYSVILCLLILFAYGCNSNNDLLSEQKLLKDSANNINERIGDYMHKGHYDSAAIEKLRLGAVYDRLIGIQKSIDSLEKAR